MKRSVFYILTLLFTVILFSQPCFCNWWQHKKITGGYVRFASDIAWVGNYAFIYGGMDTDNFASLRHYDVNGNMQWQQRLSKGSVKAVAVPSGQLSPYFFAYTPPGARHVGLRYIANGGWIGKLGNDAGGMTDLMFVDDTLFTGSEHGWINRWEVSPTRIIHRWAYRSAPKPIFSLAHWVENVGVLGASPNTTDIVHLVADGDNNVDVRRWDGKVTQNAFSGGHSRRINSIAAGYSWKTWSTVIATGGEDKKIVIWDSKGRRLYDLPGGGAINSVDIHGKRSLLASGGDDYFVTLWTINSNYTLSFKQSFLIKASIRVIKFSPDGYHLAVGTNKGIYIFKTNEVP